MIISKNALYKKCPYRFATDVLGIALRPYQQKFIGLLDQDYMHQWARQTGKDVAIIAATMWKAMMFDHVDIIIMARHNRMKEVFSDFSEIIRINELPSIYGSGRQFEFDKTGSRITIVDNIPHGSTCDYVFYNQDIEMQFTPLVNREGNKPIIHIIDTGYAINCNFPVQKVSWKDVDSSLFRASIVLDQMGESRYKEEMLATSEDIEQIKAFRSFKKVEF